MLNHNYISVMSQKKYPTPKPSPEKRESIKTGTHTSPPNHPPKKFPRKLRGEIISQGRKDRLQNFWSDS